ncbi:Phosphoenolpyruvate transferase [subsurface metagenome]
MFHINVILVVVHLNENFDNKLLFLSGGTGTPKLLMGFRKILNDDKLTIIGNTADDDIFYGLLVSPDIDTLIYLFSDQLDLKKFWGVKNESFNVLNQIEKYGEEIWFRLGDKDLGLHLVRNKLLLQGCNYHEIVQELCSRLGVTAKIIPMTNNHVRTKLLTKSGLELSFQEYTVKMRENITIQSVCYEGCEKAAAVEEAVNAISNADTIIIGPSNPITSIGPILSIRELKTALCNTEAKIIAVSPLSSGKAFSGPAARLMNELNIESTSLGIAKLYREFLDTAIICNNDKELQDEINKLGIETICTNISLKTENEREELTKIILKECKK